MQEAVAEVQALRAEKSDRRESRESRFARLSRVAPRDILRAIARHEERGCVQPPLSALK